LNQPTYKFWLNVLSLGYGYQFNYPTIRREWECLGNLFEITSYFCSFVMLVAKEMIFFKICINCFNSIKKVIYQQIARCSVAIGAWCHSLWSID